MKKLLLTLPLLLLQAALPVAAQVDEKTHEKCISAADYAGCVKVNSELKQVNGNACAPGYAYVGDDTCREVECRLLVKRHSPILGGRMWKCRNWYADATKLYLGESVDMVYDPSCPAGKPEIGWNSTCNAPYEEPPKADRVWGRKS